VPESYNLECTRTPEGGCLMDEKPAKTLELYPYIALRGRGGVVEFGLREVIALASSGAIGALLTYGCQKWIKR
jgi:hypothetical protein